MTTIDIFLALVVNLLYGSTFTFGKYVMAVFTPVFVYCLRFLLAGLLVTPFNIKKIKYDKDEFFWMFVTATFNAISFVFLAIGLSKLDSSVSAIINRVDIPFTIVLSALIYKEKIHWNTILGIVICFFSIYLISGDVKITEIKYIFINLVCPFFMSCANITSKKTKLESSVRTPIINLISGLELLLYCLFFEDMLKVPFTEITMQSWFSLFYLTIFATHVCYVGLFYLLKKYNSSKIMPYNFVRPIFTIVLGLIVLGEVITTKKIIGTILIISGVLVSQLLTKKTSEKEIGEIKNAEKGDMEKD
ncbi:MAG: DMT family transporter [Rickettsiales bacterium]|jgi:O-acetylserine/cysteine efflux transporter|nr:DMT family transporter [Rickettsiales bacterium]